MSGPKDPPPDFGAAIADAREDSDRLAAKLVSRLKAMALKRRRKTPPAHDPPAES